MIRLKVTRAMLDEMRVDLRRRHPFALERVGFLACRFAQTPSTKVLVLAARYEPVADEDYIDEPGYGALIGSAAFRKAMQLAYSQRLGQFHVHLHEGRGKPRPSGIDLRESSRFVPDFFHVRPDLPHGILILSSDSLWGLTWLSARREPTPISGFRIVGLPMERIGE